MSGYSDWEDTSVWSQRDEDRSVPTSWTLMTSMLEIIVHRRIEATGVWFLTCREVE